MLTYQALSTEMLDYVFHHHMTKDFPAEELKPLEALKALQQKGLYEVYGFYDDQTLVAYAMLVREPSSRYLLLDYLAVCAQFRSHGYGSQCLQLLKAACSDRYAGMLAELERPDTTEDPAERDIRQRRIQFYVRNGLRATNIYSTLFQIPFVLYYFPFTTDPDDDTLYQQLDQIYHAMFPQPLYTDHVRMNRKS